MTRDDHSGYRIDRRRYLLAAGAAGAVGLSGCLGLGGSGGGNDGPDDPTSDGGDGATTTTGAGGEVSLSGDAGIELRASAGSDGLSDIDMLETLSVRFEEMTFLQQEGDGVTVPIDETVDLTGTPDDGAVLQSADSFPAGTFTEATLVASIETATDADGTDVTFDWDGSHTLDLEIVDDYLTLEAGQTLVFTLLVSVRERDGSWSLSFGQARTYR